MSVDKASLGIGFVLGAAVASTISYVLHQKKSKQLLEDYDERLTAEVKSTVEHIRSEGLDLVSVIIDDNLNDDPDLPDDLSNESVKMAEDSEGVDTVTPPVPKSLEKPSLQELAERSNQKVAYHKIIEDSVYGATDGGVPLPEEAPYQDENISVIGQDLFLSNISEYEQQTLTYFADGGVLDASGHFVDYIPLIGQGVPPFGSQSEDPEVVYLRNKKLEKEFEVLKDPGVAADFASPNPGGQDYASSNDFLSPDERVEDSDTLQHSIELLANHLNGNERR